MLITIIADASHCPETKVAGYGFWIAGQRGKMSGSGAMRELCASSTVAEMQAIVNALHTGISTQLIQSNDHVLCQTDSTAAISGLSGVRVVQNDQEKVTKLLLDQLCNRHILTVEFRHVKGHTGRMEARYASNRHCDIQARREMRMARKIFLNHQESGNE